MRPVPDDEFKLCFPIAKDRTLRRIATLKIMIIIMIPVLILFLGVGAHYSRPHDPRWPDHYGEMNVSSPFFSIFLFSAILLILTIPALIAINIIEGIVFTRRYGWRAASDPIEAQRIAMRDALYDVATGSVQAVPDHDDNRLIIVPTRRLRPIRARLKLMAERDKAQAQHKT